MLTEQQEEIIYELAKEVKEIANLSNDDYFYKMILYPEEIVGALHDEGKEHLAEELKVSWKNALISPEKYNQETNYIRRLWHTVSFIRDNRDYAVMRAEYSDVIDKLYLARLNFNENIEKVNEILKHDHKTEARRRILDSLQRLLDLYALLNDRIITPMIGLESKLIEVQESFGYSISTLSKEHISVLESVNESLLNLWVEVNPIHNTANSLSSENLLQEENYSKNIQTVHGNVSPILQDISRKSLTISRDIKTIRTGIERVANGETDFLYFSGKLIKAGYENMMFSLKDSTNELEPLALAIKNELRRLEGEQEERGDHRIEKEIEKLTTVNYLLKKITKRTEESAYTYLTNLEILKNELVLAGKEWLEQGKV